MPLNQRSRKSEASYASNILDFVNVSNIMTIAVYIIHPELVNVTIWRHSKNIWGNRL